ncbi:hypothetical protein NE237_003336 [Protea cynaroides]|uniref:MIT domain-containing protein n=1 Tax=Protea cynaroides TaxID=273540 RepID=A0A9Q0KGT0_9MAGN|nr:hypothetical protein NE237_003336 [Protea cynaroides]
MCPCLHGMCIKAPAWAPRIFKTTVESLKLGLRVFFLYIGKATLIQSNLKKGGIEEEIVICERRKGNFVKIKRNFSIFEDDFGGGLGGATGGIHADDLDPAKEILPSLSPTASMGKTLESLAPWNLLARDTSLIDRESKARNQVSPIARGRSLQLCEFSMYSNFKEQGIEYAKQAVHEDNAGNYSKAFPLYMNALEYFKTHLKYEKDPKIKEAINQKFTEYLRRAEEIRAVLDYGGTGAASNGDTAVATRPKDGEGGDGEQDKLRSSLNMNDFKEYYFTGQAIEYVKQAVHEDDAGNYSKAFPLYMNALEYFKTHLKYEKNPKIIEAINQKFMEYLRRAEEIRTVLDDGGTGPASNGDASCQ